MWQINFRKQPLKELASMPKEDSQKVLSAINILRKNPFDTSKLDIKKLHGRKNEWRLRVGNYRVIYEILRAEILIDIIKIEPRGDIYK